MTSSSTQLSALARSFAAHGEVDERTQTLILRGTFASADEQARWLALRGLDIAPFRSLQVYDPAVMGDVDPAEPFAPERRLMLTLVKPDREHVAVFVFSAGATSYLQTEAPSPKIVCAELEPRAAFKARGLEMCPWDPNEPITAPALPIAVKARPYVRDFVPAREVAEDLSPWILVAEPAVESTEYRAWRAVASRRLLGALVSSVVQENGVIWLQASGPPIVRFRADDPNLAAAVNALTACANWVFLSGQDVEVRHLIFAAELARAFRPDEALSDIASHALDSAKATYEAHVQSASRETLKALGDLRKSVIDEAQKVTQRAQDLTGGLWRDVAVSSAPFVLKVLGDATKGATPAVTAGFYFAAAIFILTSFALQTQINKSYLDNQREARARWFETLYSYVSADERQRIADGPIAAAEASYETTKERVGYIYLVLVVIMFGFGIASLVGMAQDAKPVPAASGPAPSAVSQTTRPSPAP